MKHLWILALLPVCASGQAVHDARYGVANSFDFTILDATGAYDVNEVDSGTEVVLFCDEGDADGTVATNDFVDETNFYSIALTAAEMACARIVVDVGATTREIFIIETYGHPLAQNPGVGSSVITYGSAQSGAASSITLAAATSFADDFLNGMELCVVGDTGSGQCRLITDWVSATDTATVNSAWGTNPASGSDYFVYGRNQAYIAVNSSGRPEVNLKEIDDDATAAPKLETFADGSPIAQTGDAYALVGSTANAEPTSPPSATASLAAKIGWLFAMARNKLTQSATEQCLRNDADAADVGCAPTSDSGTVFTRGEFVP